MRRLGQMTVVPALALLLARCEAASGPAEAACSASYPPGASSALHVAQTCASVSPDGSPERPYGTLQAAIDAAPAGATVLVAPGVYAENLVIERALTLIGASADVGSIILQTPSPADASVIVKVPTADELSVIVKAPQPDAVRVHAAGVVIQGLAIETPSGIGLVVHADTTVRAVRIVDASAQGGAGGQGVAVVDGAHVVLEGVALLGSAAEAIFLQQAGGGAMRHCLVQASGGAGLSVNGAADGLTVVDSVIQGNTQAGVVVFEGVGIILQNNAITGTRADAKGIGDGVLVQRLDGRPAPHLELREGNRVEGNARVGVLFSGVEDGVIVKSEVLGNSRGGVWIQGDPGAGAGVELDGVIVKHNAYAGVTITRGAQAAVRNSSVSETQEGVALDMNGSDVRVADGIGVFASAGAYIEGNTVAGSVRAGILIDGARPDRSSVLGNTVTGNRVGIILQHPLPAGAVALGDNTSSQNADGDLVTAPEASLAIDPLSASGLSPAGTGP